MIRLANILLRGITLLCKFSLIVFLARFLSLDELALYGLLVATIAYAIYPLGFEFYTYSTREIIGLESSVIGEYFKNQLGLHFLLYLTCLPLFSFLFYFGLLSYRYILFFYFILILEHLNQELFRMQIALSRQLPASLALFFRQGVWGLIIVLIMFFYPSTRTLENVLLAWVVGGVLSLFISLYAFFEIKPGGWGNKLNWAWVRKGLWVAIPLFVATLGTNGVMVVDKYFIDFMQGKEVLAVYVFYLSLSVSLISFLDAGVFSFLYPRMIVSAKNGDWVELIGLMKKMLAQVSFVSFMFLGGAYVFLDYLIEWVGKDAFSEKKYLFYVLLLAAFVRAISYIPHYALYALRKDGPIIYSGISSLFVFASFTSISYYFEFDMAVPLSLVATFFIVLLWKLFSFLAEYRKLTYAG